MRLSESELLQRVADVGRPVDSRQLRRWRQAGVVPSPRVTHRPGRPGSRSEYEEWVVEQIVTVADLLAETRSFRHVLIELWWSARWVDRGRLRDALVHPLQRLRREVERLAEQTGGDSLDLAEAMADQAEREAPNHGGWGSVGARLGPNPEHRRRVSVGLALLALGQDVAWDVHDDAEAPLRELFEQATGLRRAAQDDLGGGPWLAQIPNIDRELPDLTGGLSLDPRRTGEAITEATEQQLDEARDVAHWIVEKMAPATAALEARLGPDVGGLASIGEIAERTSLADTTKLVLFGLAARRIAPGLVAAIVASASAKRAEV